MLPRVKKTRKRKVAGWLPVVGAIWTMDDALRHYDIQRWQCGLSFKAWIIEAQAAGQKMEWSDL